MLGRSNILRWRRGRTADRTAGGADGGNIPRRGGHNAGDDGRMTHDGDEGRMSRRVVAGATTDGATGEPMVPTFARIACNVVIKHHNCLPGDT